jgi:integrase
VAGKFSTRPEGVAGKPLSESTVSKRWKKALLRSGVGPVETREYKQRGKVYERPFPLLRLHELRHTFASHAIATGAIALRELQQWMGHKSATTTERYAHFMPADDAADRLGQAQSQSPSNPPQNDRDGSEVLGSASNPRARWNALVGGWGNL